MRKERAEYIRQVNEAEGKIRQLEARRNDLEAQRARLNVDQVAEARRIREELDEIAGAKSDLTLLKDLAQEQLAKWQKGMAQAAPLIGEAKKVHSHARGTYDRFPKIQQEVIDLVKDLDNDNNEMGRIAQEFRDTTGEDLNLPYPIACHQAAHFAHMQRIKPDAYSPWDYVPESEQRKQRAEEEAKARRGYEERLRVAEAHVPPCATCGGARRIASEAGAPGDGYWNAFCDACRTTHRVLIAEAKTKK